MDKHASGYHDGEGYAGEYQQAISRLVALPTMVGAILFAYMHPEPGVLPVLAFDVVLAGCFVPLALGIYWKRSNAPGAIASIASGAAPRIYLYFQIPPSYIGLDTLIPPAISLAVFSSCPWRRKTSARPGTKLSPTCPPMKNWSEVSTRPGCENVYALRH
jgi:hypothetical protein